MKKYDVVAIVGEYQGKKKYHNSGMVIESNGKYYLKLTSLPFDDNGKMVNFFSLYEPKKESSQPAQHEDPNDQIPF